MLLKGKTAVVSGGSRGIGLAIVKRFLEEGANVALCGSREETARRALDGILAYRRAGSVTPANVESVAVRHGIKVDTASIADADEYASAVKVVADGVEVGATLFGSMQRPRIMSLLDYKIDIAPAKQSLVFEYVDAPGRIGAIGTLLGNEGVNITTMQIGTKPSEKTALVYMNVEGNVNDQLLEKLSSTLDFKNVWSFSL